MNDTAAPEQDARDYSNTLFLPQTDFPMRGGLPQREPEWLKRWEDMDLYARLRADAASRDKFTLHDGPPYANGNIHIGHALNKTLKDLVTRSMQMLGYNAAYVPGWDCHGLPIEWKIEEQYRARGRNKDEVPVNEFRKECRDFALKWIDVQREEFKRLGITGDWQNPYLTMSFDAEAQIARELMKFAMSGQLYRGSKPVMWSVVERTALAEAEIEYHDYESDTIWVKFPVNSTTSIGVGDDEERARIDEWLRGAYVLIWTTTPWTIPGNRAISFSSRIDYGLYEVTQPDDPEAPRWARFGERYVIADNLAADVFARAKVEEGGWKKVASLSPIGNFPQTCAHPLKGLAGGYAFEVPLLDGEHVTDDAGTGFVHTAPGHGTDDFEVWMANSRQLRARGIDPAIPFTVDDAGYYTADVPGLGPDAAEGAARVIDDKGNKGDANKRVIAALVEANALVARGRLKHQYPHSWRSKKPIIFRNTPQWFVYMDKDLSGEGDTLRARALTAIDRTRFVPPQGQNRLRSMIQDRPDWVLSRQRAWGVPIAIFVNAGTGEILKDEDVNARIADAFEAEGADAWFADGAAERFLAGQYDAAEWTQVRDILDVWFDSGSTHAFVLRNSKKWPDLKFPASLYLEGSDQHRGWFHSSLLESCGTNGHAPYEAVLTHGFTQDGEGRKMSKSLGNTVAPQDIVKKYGADILRLWTASTDYWEDQRLGEEILKTTVESYRKLRNTMRWILGNLAHYRPEEAVDHADMPELERYVLHRLHTLDGTVRQAYRDFDYKRVVSTLSNFMNLELSAFYFDVRKDALYCDPISSVKRRASLTVLDRLFACLTTWLAPVLVFTMEEVWLARYPQTESSVHLQLFPDLPAQWADERLAERWSRIRTVRRVVTGALEIERREKRIGSSLEAAPKVYVSDADLVVALHGQDFAEICITSGIEIVQNEGPAEAFRLEDVPGVSVVPALAEGRRCARSWKILPDVGSDADYPDLSPRDALAMRERLAAGLDA
ncbi:MAG TPA: isoleucine--tRNA ligase [Devosiaceae bacterium]